MGMGFGKTPKKFFARYDGWCEAGGDRIQEGDEVCYDDSDRVVHAECVGEDNTIPKLPTRQDPVCPKCRVLHPASFDCDDW